MSNDLPTEATRPLTSEVLVKAIQEMLWENPLFMDGCEYDVEWAPPDNSDLKMERANLGICRMSHGTMTIDSGMPPYMCLFVLLHEIVHALIRYRMCGSILSEEVTEGICDSVAGGMIDLMARNPKFMFLLTDLCKQIAGTK